MIKQYRKKPLVIEAIQWTNKANNFTKILKWSNGKVNSASPLLWQDADSFCLQVETMEGIMLARLNDYIIKGVKGEFYPCKPDVFEQTYELI